MTQRLPARLPRSLAAVLMAASLFCLTLAAPLRAAPDAKSDQPPAAEAAAPATAGQDKANKEAQAKAEQEAKAKQEAEEKARQEAEEKARQEAELKAKQEAEAAAAKLRAEAEAAQQNNESSGLDDALWEEAFQQNQDELKAMEIEIGGLAGELKAIVAPLHKGLPGMEESARRLFTLSASHKNDPVMLESVDQRGMLLASSLRQQMQPPLTARNVVREKLAALDEMKKSLPPLPERGKAARVKLDEDQMRTWKEIGRVENQLKRMDQRLDLELTPADLLLGKLDKMHAEVAAYLPGLWQRYYLSVPSRFFDPVAWDGIADRWNKTLQNMGLRLSIDVPRGPGAWQGVGLRFLNVLLLGGDTDTHQTQGGGALRALLVFQQRLDFGHLAQG